jgi:hypothetical protein
LNFHVLIKTHPLFPSVEEISFLNCLPCQYILDAVKCYMKLETLSEFFAPLVEKFLEENIPYYEIN